MHHKGNLVVGAIFVVLGGLFLLNNLNLVDLSGIDIGYIFATFWPLFIIIPGIALQYSYFSGSNRDAGILVPAGVLLTIGTVCQLSMLFDLWHILWPGFILAPAVGLYELYYYGTREKALLIPVAILGGLSLLFFASFSVNFLFRYRFGGMVVPILLIAVGVIILFRNKHGDGSF